jgi:L-serine kinase (ADP)
MESYRIKESDVCLEIALIDLDRLHIHEEVIPAVVDQLAESIVKDKVLRNPVMVDKNSLVVLDGMHRVAALRKIGCRRMPVCLVDYNNPAIGLFEWYRTLKGDRVEQRVTESARTLGLKLKKSEYDEGMKALEAGLADALLIMRDNICFQVMNGGQNLKSAFVVVKKLENQLIASGLNVGYETASDAEKQLKTGKVDMVFAIPPIKKSDVLKQGVRDEPFPHKVTRHTVPARPLELDVPFDLLKDEKLTNAEVNRKFLDMLNSRNVRRVPAGSVIEGRRYDEEVFLFNEH